MKKFILLFLTVICTGCGNKLLCSYEEKFEDIKVSNQILFNFKDNTYKETDVMVFKSDSEALDYFKDIEEYIDIYNLVLDKNKIISNIDGEIKLDSNKKSIKDKYQSYDYKCR